MMGSCIGLRNLIIIGFEAQLSLRDDEYDIEWLDGLERMFLCIYCAEAMFRAFSFGWQIIWDPWFVLDLTLVVVGLLALVLVPVLTIGNVGHMPAIKKLFAVRSLRLLRLMRVLRMLRHFKIIWRLVIGFLTAWGYHLCGHRATVDNALRVFLCCSGIHCKRWWFGSWCLAWRVSIWKSCDPTYCSILFDVKFGAEKIWDLRLLAGWLPLARPMPYTDSKCINIYI